MSTSSNKNAVYYLKYGTFDYMFIGVVLLLVSCVAASVAVLSLEVAVQKIGFLVSAICGLGGAYCLRTAKHYKRQGAWYLSFNSSQVCINFFDYKNAGSAPQTDTGIFGIPLEHLIWIRRTEKGGFGDSDECFVDMCVSPKIWTAAKRYRTEFNGHVSPTEDRSEVGFAQFFETDIIRILLSQSQWPEDLTEHWVQFGYPVIEDYEIEFVSEINPA